VNVNDKAKMIELETRQLADDVRSYSTVMNLVRARNKHAGKPRAGRDVPHNSGLTVKAMTETITKIRRDLLNLSKELSE